MQSSRTTKAHHQGSEVGLLICILVLLFSSIASGYRPPASSNSNVKNSNNDGSSSSNNVETKDASSHHIEDSSNVHIVATRWAIDLLEADGQSFEAHATLKKHFEVLAQGLRDAETSGGEFSLKKTATSSDDETQTNEENLFHRNVFGHFVDASASREESSSARSLPQGLELFDGAIDNEEALAKVLPVAGVKEEPSSHESTNNKWKLDAARGPNIALTDLIDWHYALAVEHMKQGELQEAILNLGYVAHFVQDATVPQRGKTLKTNRQAELMNSNKKKKKIPVSRDAWLRSESHLVEYENECEELLLKSELLPPAEGGIYKTASEWKPHDYVTFAAANAQPFAKSFLEAPTFNKTLASIAAKELVPLSAKLTAGLFIR